ncbi:MAG TPA: VOC family protein, partial [Steroidobacteraceae bacterium]
MNANQKTCALQKLPLRLHHHAYTTDDHEATRHFYEDILGIPLVAMDIEKENLLGEWVELGLAYYELGDGSALAFFNFADPKKQAEWRAKKQSLFVHLSLAVEKSTQQEIERRLQAAHWQCFTINHAYCFSLYATDPNGLLLEFTVDAPNAEKIQSTMKRSAHEEMKRWIAGGRACNNQWRAA